MWHIGMISILYSIAASLCNLKILHDIVLVPSIVVIEYLHMLCCILRWEGVNIIDSFPASTCSYI